MADELRQRRGKKSSGTPATTADASPADNAAVPGDPKPTPIEQLRNAQARLVLSRDRMLDLHASWKTQLFTMSCLIVLVTLYQLQTSIATCIHEIKRPTTEAQVDAGATTGADALQLIFGTAFSEIVGVVIAALLTCFLALDRAVPRTPLVLERWPYMVSSALVPLCLSFYFHIKQRGCVAGEADAVDLEEPDAKEIRHQFPVVVIYHTIVTIAAWFMKSGIQKAEEHVDLVTDSIRDFERMDKKLAMKRRQLKGRAGGK